MKHLKKFESIEDNPQIGDYVICEDKYDDEPEIAIFISQNIGQCIDIKPPIYSRPIYIIQYKNIPKKLKSEFTSSWKEGHKYRDILELGIDEIKYWSKNKKDLYRHK